MNAGKIEQAGSPEDIYDRPRSEFVARFIGMSNVFKGKALDGNRVSFAGVPLRVTGDPLQPAPRPRSRSASTRSSCWRGNPRSRTTWFRPR